MPLLTLTPRDLKDDTLQIVMQYLLRDMASAEICGKVYPRSYLYSRHYLVHSDKKEFECGLCGKFFKTPGDLKAHMKVRNQVA